MPEYSNSKLYKIWSPSHPGEIYIGSTTQSLARRMVGHRTKFKGYQNGKYPYTTSFKILEYGDARIELIEKFPCKCKEELIAREGYYIRTLDCVNKVIPGRTMKEWYQDNQEQIVQQHKQYYLDNKEQIAQQHKQYYLDKKDEIAQQHKQYYKDNKDKLKAYKSEKITCECGSITRRDSLAKHRRSKKHMNYIKNVVSSGRTLLEL